jgi:hypothetical protein
VNLPDPTKCRVMGEGLRAAVVGEMSTVALCSFDSENNLCGRPITSLEAEFVSEVTRSRISCTVQRTRPDQYQISYQPIVKGRHQLHVKAEGQHIGRSPYNLLVSSPVDKLSTPILTIGGVKGPWGVAINQRGEAVVTEKRGDCISVLHFCV